MKAFSFVISFLVFMSLAQLEFQWMYNTGDFIDEVGISPDSSYIAAIGMSNGERIYVFDRNGNLLWKREGTSLSFSKNNYIVVGGKGIALLTKNGELLWEYKNASNIRKVFISEYGERIIGVGETELYILNRNGELITHLVFNKSIRASASSCGYYIAVGTENGTLYFFEDGRLIWTQKLSGRIYPLSVSVDGNYVVAGVGSKLYFLGSNGKLLWSYSVNGNILDVQISENNYIAVESVEIGDVLGSTIVGTTHLYLLDKSGNLMWSRVLSPTSYYSFSSGVSDASGVFYCFDVSTSRNSEFVVAVVGSRVYLFNNKGKILWESEVGEWSGVEVSRDGKYIVVSSQNGEIKLLFNKYAESLAKTKTVTKTIVKKKTNTVTVTETKSVTRRVICGNGFIILLSLIILTKRRVNHEGGTTTWP